MEGGNAPIGGQKHQQDWGRALEPLHSLTASFLQPSADGWRVGKEVGTGCLEENWLKETEGKLGKVSGDYSLSNYERKLISY